MCIRFLIRPFIKKRVKELFEKERQKEIKEQLFENNYTIYKELGEKLIPSLKKQSRFIPYILSREMNLLLWRPTKESEKELFLPIHFEQRIKNLYLLKESGAVEGLLKLYIKNNRGENKNGKANKNKI